ncbi:MAG TPA: hypothetical protein RMH99_14625, partial [Sandaracinaceae bacterium LLY-WYZ-13_1]|nr:hypothetical protein [Sandaracinaceae bacterium LLY-WYZ-13_1]
AGPSAAASTAAPADPDARGARPAPPRGDDPETRLFSEAHRTHFGEGGPAAALAAWDRYLGAHPHGRYEPEARYNRALTLVRLGRLEAARAVLETFARGRFDGYRRAEARDLVEALDARIDEER